MLKMNKKMEYSLMALKYIATQGPEKLVSAREVCDKLGTPFDTTAKVMQVMNSKGILNSVKGTKGGYNLSKSLSEINYLELERIIEDDKEIDNFCKTGKGFCELIEKCNIVSPISQLNKKLNVFLSKLTLDELLMENDIKDVGIPDIKRAEREESNLV